MKSFAVFFAVFAAFAARAGAQLSPVPVKSPPLADTTNESPIYPVGDATPVYRAVLDLIYLDGSKRPPVIIMLDTAERRTSGFGNAWMHKSKMDTATVLAFARF